MVTNVLSGDGEIPNNECEEEQAGASRKGRQSERLEDHKQNHEMAAGSDMGHGWGRQVGSQAKQVSGRQVLLRSDVSSGSWTTG